MKSRLIAILGANGKIGSEITHRLGLVDGFQLVAICRSEVGAERLRSPNCEVRIGSVMSKNFDPSVLADCEIVINCVWPVGRARDVIKQNSILATNIARQASIKHFISFSSVAVYGSCIDNSWNSFANPKPDGVYGKSKLESEKFFANYFQYLGKSFHLIRLGHVYGPSQTLSKQIWKLSEDGRFQLPYDGSLPSNTIHIQEVAESLMLLIKCPSKSGIYNLASNPQRSWREVFDWHTNICGMKTILSLNNEIAKNQHALYLRKIRKSSYIFSFIINIIIRIFVKLWQLVQKIFIPSWSLLKKIWFSVNMLIQNNLAKINNNNLVSIRSHKIYESENPNPIYYCDSMPGPQLHLPNEWLCDEEVSKRNIELINYYNFLNFIK